MATRAQVIEKLAFVAGLNPMTIELTLRYLAKAGFVPRGQPGKRSEHYSDEHLKNLILAFAGHQPVDAVKAVYLLNELRCSPYPHLDRATSPSGISCGVFFGEWLKQEIRSASKLKKAAIASCDLDTFTAREIGMTVNPPSAFNSCRANKLITKYDYFFPDETLSEDPLFARPLIFKAEFLVAVGELLSDASGVQITPLIPDPAPGSAGEGDATSETMKASGTGIHEGLQSHQPATRAYPALAQTAHSSKAHSNAQEGGKQSPPAFKASRVAGSSSPDNLKDSVHGTYWIDQAPPPPN